MKKLSVIEFAKLVGLSHDTVTRMVKAKQLKGEKKNPFVKNSAFVIDEAEVSRLLKARKSHVKVSG